MMRGTNSLMLNAWFDAKCTGLSSSANRVTTLYGEQRSKKLMFG